MVPEGASEGGAPEGASEGGASEGIPILSEGVPCDSVPLLVPNHLLDPPVSAPSLPLQLPIGLPPPLRRSTRNRKPPDRLDPSSHLAAYCNDAGIERPTANLGLSLQGLTQTDFSFASKDKLPKIRGECMAQSFSANLNWSKVLTMLDIGLSSLSAFAIEIRKHTSYSAAGTNFWTTSTPPCLSRLPIKKTPHHSRMQ